MGDGLLIVDARIVNEGEIREGDVHVRGARIAEIGGDLQSREADEVIDARGMLLLPGLVDEHVHFREPGLTAAGDVRTESRAAVAGGITSYMEMPNTDPPTTTLEALESKHAIAARDSMANHSFYLGATRDNADEIRALNPGAACGVKVFVGASTGGMILDDPEALATVLRDSPVPVAAHCESTPLIEASTRACLERFGEDAPASCHPLVRSEEACFAASSFAVGLARENDARLHVLHVTTARELDLFEPGPPEGKRITAEVCVHHLWFDDSDYERLGNLVKCNPAVKTRSDRDALRAALDEGRIDAIATDHAPHALADKARRYLEAPSGIPSVQHALPALLDLCRKGALSLERVVERACHAPARLFGIRDRGYVREGYFADLALVDPDRPRAARRADVLHKCGWSPFEGHTFSSSVVATVVNGRVAYRDGAFDDSVRGARLEFDR